MSKQDTQAVSSVSWSEGMSGVVTPQALDEDWSPVPDAPTTDFTTAIDGTLHLTAELAHCLIGTHQAATSLIIASTRRHTWARAKVCRLVLVSHSRSWFRHPCRSRGAWQFVLGLLVFAIVFLVGAGRLFGRAV